MTIVEEDFGKQAAIERMKHLVLLHLREESFLSATRFPEWMTLDELVSCLDEASYWTGDGWTNLTEPEPPPENSAAKRKHVREMLEWLWSVRDEDEPLPSNNVFLSRFATTDEGSFERVFKQASLCSVSELEDLADDKGASYEFNQHRLDDLTEGVDEIEAGGSFSLADFYMQELSENTMKAAWPTLDKDGREWVVAVGVKLRIALGQMMEAVGEEQKANSPVSSEWMEDRLERGVEGVWDGLVKEFAEKQNIGLEEAERFVRQDAITLFSSEFAEVLRDFHDGSFGWTLDEQLMFAVDERKIG